MAQVFRCPDCNNVTRFDKYGDGRCTECGDIMEKIEEKDLSEKNRIALLNKEGKEMEKPLDLGHNGKDILEQ